MGVPGCKFSHCTAFICPVHPDGGGTVEPSARPATTAVTTPVSSPVTRKSDMRMGGAARRFLVGLSSRTTKPRLRKFQPLKEAAALSIARRRLEPSHRRHSRKSRARGHRSLKPRGYRIPKHEGRKLRCHANPPRIARRRSFSHGVKFPDRNKTWGWHSRLRRRSSRPRPGFAPVPLPRPFEARCSVKTTNGSSPPGNCPGPL